MKPRIEIFTQLAETISLLKRQHGDKLAYTIASQIVMQEEIINQIKRAHPYAISEYKGKWRTRVRCAGTNDGRKQIYGNSEAELCVKLVEWYGLTADQTISLNILYIQWIQYREETVGNPNTVLRNKQHYRKYFENSDFWDTKLCDLNKPDLKKYCIEVVKTNKLTRKEWNNAKGILNGMFNLAMEKDIISNNPLVGLNIPKAFFRQPAKKTKDTEIFSDDEISDFLSWCDEQFEESLEVMYLFPILNFNVGMRAGEAVALTWDDWDGRYLTISKEEIRNQETGECSVVQHTKTYNDRTVVLSKDAVKALERLELFKDENIQWVFHKNGLRLRERQVIYVLEKYARHRGIKYKSTHKIRKTFGSNLYGKYGFTPKQCADYLGHDERTFLNHYNFDTSNELELIAKLDNPNNPK